MDSRKRSLIRNAFTICEGMLSARGILGEPSNVCEEAQFLGEKMFESIVAAVEDYVIEEVDILFLSGDLEDIDHESDSSGDESSESSSSESDTDQYEEDSETNNKRPTARRKFSYEEREAAVKSWERPEHRNLKLKTLKTRASLRGVKSLAQLRKWQREVNAHGNRVDKLDKLSQITFDKFVMARQRLMPVTIGELRTWAIDTARSLEIDNFTGSRTWISKFMRIHGIRQRRISRFISCKEVTSQDAIKASADLFKTQMAAAVLGFDKKMVINTDQTGCEYQTMRNRTYSHKGEKTTLVATKNVSKTSHSYTAQYTINLDGSLIGKVFLCMQEINGKFGPRCRCHLFQIGEVEYAT